MVPAPIGTVQGEVRDQPCQGQGCVCDVRGGRPGPALRRAGWRRPWRGWRRRRRGGGTGRGKRTGARRGVPKRSRRTEIGAAGHAWHRRGAPASRCREIASGWRCRRARLEGRK
eukprot:scaffold12197_cov90-Isochrysis_galbana.AAC.3